MDCNIFTAQLNALAFVSRTVDKRTVSTDARTIGLVNGTAAEITIKMVYALILASLSFEAKRELTVSKAYGMICFNLSDADDDNAASEEIAIET